jgi:hypothetical protein
MILWPVSGAEPGLACGGNDPTSPTDRRPVLASIAPDSGNVGTAVELRGQSFAKGAVMMFDNKTAPKISYLGHAAAYAPDGPFSIKLRGEDPQREQRVQRRVAPYKTVAPVLTVVNGVSNPAALSAAASS